jgi:hypothetical protein
MAMEEERIDEKPNVFDSPKLLEYKALETRLYGELMKACRRYHNKLSIISIVGILDLVNQEMKDLDKSDFKIMEEGTIRNRDPLDRLL